MESENKALLDELFENIGGYLESFGDYAKEARKRSDGLNNSYLLFALEPKRHDRTAPAKVVVEYDGDKTEEELYFNEEDAIAAMFYSCFILNPVTTNYIPV